MTQPDYALRRAIGQRVRSARKSAELTQKELGAKLGYSRVTIVNIEKGSQGITVVQLVMLAEALGKEAAELLPPMAEIGVQDKPCDFGRITTQDPRSCSSGSSAGSSS